jgi:hypothetical protein
MHRALCATPFRQMRVLTILIIGLLTWGQANGQLILTEEENLAWVKKLRVEKDLSVQLEVIKARILADTNVYVKSTGDVVTFKSGKNENKKDGLCRPILVVEGYFIKVDNNTDKQTIENLTKELTTDNIKQLEVVDGQKAKDLFGQNGWCGVVLMTAKNKKAKKSLLRYKI